MIKVTDRQGRKHAYHPDAIANVCEAHLSDRWNGINSYIRLFDGTERGVREALEQVLEQIERASTHD